MTAKWCGSCGGQGKHGCPECLTTGEVVCPDCDGLEIVTCGMCGGHGQITVISDAVEKVEDCLECLVGEDGVPRGEEICTTCPSGGMVVCQACQGQTHRICLECNETGRADAKPHWRAHH